MKEALASFVIAIMWNELSVASQLRSAFFKTSFTCNAVAL